MPKGYPSDPETAFARRSAAHKGKPKSAEWRAKMSAIHTGRPLSPEHRAAMLGISKSPEHRDKLSAANRGHTQTPEAKAKMSEYRRGRPLGPFTPEHCANIAASITPEERAQRSARAKGNLNLINAPVKGECVYCFGPAQTRDHVIPRGRPGWNDPANIVWACRSCNASKAQRTPDEWLVCILLSARPSPPR